MPNQYISGNVTNANIAVTLVGGEQLLIATTGSVVSTGNIAIMANGSNNLINVLGTVFGGSDAIRMGGMADTNNGNRVFVAESGYVNGSGNGYSINMLSYNSFIENHGTIFNQDFGNLITGSGIRLWGNSTTGTSTVMNYGTIDVAGTGISVTNSEKIHIENSGSIKALAAITGADGAMSITNTGQISGKVTLSTVGDIFDTRSGTLSGIVRGLSGDDVILGSKGSDALYGGNDVLPLNPSGNDKLYGYDGNDFVNGGDGNDYLSGGNGNDNMLGGTEVDTLTGDAGNDILDGGAGMDKLYGGAGKDMLTGGADADLFIFRKGDTTNSKTTADVILDFTSADDIDLHYIDANTKVGGDQAFTFIGTQAFHGKAGELRFVKEASDTYVYADTNGDKKSDFIIHLDDAVNMAKGHFIL